MKLSVADEMLRAKLAWAFVRLCVMHARPGAKPTQHFEGKVELVDHMF